MRIDQLLDAGKPHDLLRVLPAEERGGFCAALPDHRRAAPAEAELCIGHLRRRREHAAEDRRAGRAHPERAEDPLDGPPHLRRHTADEIGGILDDLWDKGIRNVLALRGDPPAGQTQFVADRGRLCQRATS